jgi:DNA-binding GntR family transcriptional regulator
MDVNSIVPIHITSLADVVADRIRKAIITGELNPGERLSEPALAAQLGVSRSPVREALQILKADGLVVEYPNRSSYVWLPTTGDIDEIFSLRIMIETLASEWLVEHLSGEDVRALEGIIDEERRAIAAKDLIAIMETDKHFHEYICYRSKHSRLKDWWNQLMWQWEAVLYRRIRNNPEQVLPTVIEDHSAILEAIKTHNLKQVGDLHRSINQRVAGNIKEVIHLEAE